MITEIQIQKYSVIKESKLLQYWLVQDKEGEGEKKNKFGFPSSQAQTYSVGDCRALVKTLVCGVKTITWGLAK